MSIWSVSFKNCAHTHTNLAVQQTYCLPSIYCTAHGSKWQCIRRAIHYWDVTPLGVALLEYHARVCCITGIALLNPWIGTWKCNWHQYGANMMWVAPVGATCGISMGQQDVSGTSMRKHDVSGTSMGLHDLSGISMGHEDASGTSMGQHVAPVWSNMWVAPVWGNTICMAPVWGNAAPVWGNMWHQYGATWCK